MSYGSYGGRQPGTNEVREAAREKAREIREHQKKKDRRSRAVRNGSIIGGTIAVVLIVAFVLTNFAHAPGRGPLNMISDGIKIGADLTAVRTGGVAPDESPRASDKNPDSVLDIRIYVDYLCPNCGEFMAKNGDNLQAWAESGAATVEIHPIALLTTKSAGDQYSLRAANAAACVSEYAPDAFFAFHKSLFVDQPKEGEAGFDDAELTDRAQRAGAINMKQIGDCIEERQFASWVKAATVRALNGPLPDSDVAAVSVTPTILVNGKQFKYSADFDPNELAQFVVQAAGESFNENPTTDPTPTATPSPSAKG
jgi:protein-disulfide isomerase